MFFSQWVFIVCVSYWLMHFTPPYNMQTEGKVQSEDFLTELCYHFHHRELTITRLAKVTFSLIWALFRLTGVQTIPANSLNNPINDQHLIMEISRYKTSVYGVHFTLGPQSAVHSLRFTLTVRVIFLTVAKWYLNTQGLTNPGSSCNYAWFAQWVAHNLELGQMFHVDVTFVSYVDVTLLILYFLQSSKSIFMETRGYAKSWAIFV